MLETQYLLYVNVMLPIHSLIRNFTKVKENGYRTVVSCSKFFLVCFCHVLHANTNTIEDEAN